MGFGEPMVGKSAGPNDVCWPHNETDNRPFVTGMALFHAECPLHGESRPNLSRRLAKGRTLEGTTLAATLCITFTGAWGGSKISYG
jgi:hypothetical protein